MSNQAAAGCKTISEDEEVTSSSLQSVQVDPNEMLHEMEERLGITQRAEDLHEGYLGSYPCRKYYSKGELRTDIASIEKAYQKAASRY